MIVRNRAKCLRCKDVIESEFRHDFVTCSCGAIFVDGGKAYLRHGGRQEFFEDMSEYEEKEGEGGMTGPLVDRKALIDAIAGVDVPTDMDPIRADRVIDYLRDVLTPEVLQPWEEVPGQVVPDDPDDDMCGPSTRVVNGADLHRRIFGEDR